MNKPQPIPTKVLPGFMELLPANQLLFNDMTKTISGVFEQFGFVPIDTPAIERAEVLLSKTGGDTEKQIYSFKKGDTDLALRFDLTVPLARYVSEHVHNLNFPFRRYHIGKVHRGERPQKGRYREFYQCDIDIVGKDSLNLINDAEIPAVISAVFTKLDFGPFVIRINNRRVVTGLLESLDLSSLSTEVLRVIDKLDKIGKDAMREMLTELLVSSEAIDQLFTFLSIKGTNEEVLVALKDLKIENKTFEAGISDLETVITHLKDFDVPEKNYMIDLGIARGLDYYTGTVYETMLVEHPEVGSVCSGGRYDNLAEKFTPQKLPGVGISIGLTRLFSQLIDLNIIQSGAATKSKVLVIPMIDDISIALKLASQLRARDIATETYTEDAKIKTKMSYANKKGIPYVLLVGEEEVAENLYSLKEMETGEQMKDSMEVLIQKLTDE